MTNRRLVHVRIDGYVERVVPVYLHWLEIDSEWLADGYAGIIEELCAIIADNIEEFEKRMKTDVKVVFKRVAGIEKVAIAVAVVPQESSSHSVFVIGEKSNTLFQNSDFNLTVWLGPKDSILLKREAEWPIDCVC